MSSFFATANQMAEVLISQLSSAVAILSHWASAVVYNTLDVTRLLAYNIYYRHSVRRQNQIRWATQYYFNDVQVATCTSLTS